MGCASSNECDPTPPSGRPRKQRGTAKSQPTRSARRSSESRAPSACRSASSTSAEVHNPLVRQFRADWDYTSIGVTVEPKRKRRGRGGKVTLTPPPEDSGSGSKFDALPPFNGPDSTAGLHDPRDPASTDALPLGSAMKGARPPPRDGRKLRIMADGDSAPGVMPREEL